MRLKIINYSDSSDRYKDRIGEIFDLDDESESEYSLINTNINRDILYVKKEDCKVLQGVEQFRTFESIPMPPNFKEVSTQRALSRMPKGLQNLELKEVLWIGFQTDWMDGRTRAPEELFVRYILLFKSDDREVKLDETCSVSNFNQIYGKVGTL